MLEWLRENWQFIVGTAIGLPGLIALYFTRRPNTLDYEVTWAGDLLSPQASNLDEPLTVTYQGTAIENPYVLRVRVRNTGKHAVRKADYELPITFEVEGAKVYNLFVSKQSAGGLVHNHEFFTATETGLNRPMVLPRLLNQGEWFEVQMICDGRPKIFEVKARYANQSRPMDDLIERGSRLGLRLVLGSMLTVAVCTIGIGMLTDFEGSAWKVPITVAVVLMVFLLFLSTGLQVAETVRQEVVRYWLRREKRRTLGNDS